MYACIMHIVLEMSVLCVFIFAALNTRGRLDMQVRACMLLVLLGVFSGVCFQVNGLVIGATCDISKVLLG